MVTDIVLGEILCCIKSVYFFCNLTEKSLVPVIREDAEGRK